MKTQTKVILLIISCSLSILFLTGFIWYAMQNHSQNPNIHLIILHNNDIHGRFNQVSINGSTCTNNLSTLNECYGGFARISHVLKAYRKQSKLIKDSPSVLYFFAGDIFTGTNWFSVHKDKICSDFLNILRPDAIALGNHEFDLGIDGLVSYLNDIEAPVVAANLDLTGIPKLQNTKIKNSIILKVKYFKIGIVGYLTNETISTTSAGKLHITPEIDAINRETAKLKKQGANIIIALGHSGYKMDKLIAQQCPDVDLVIGGHSHSLLLSKKNQSNPIIIEKIEGSYPTKVLQSTGKIVPVVQAYAFTKYLGYMQVHFNNGKLISVSGSPILLDSTVPQDSTVLDLIEKYKSTVDALSAEVGYTKNFINGERAICRNTECEMGDLLSDAVVSCANKTIINTCISIINSGTIRGSIQKGKISYNILELIPFNSSLVIANVSGLQLLSALSHSADLYGLDDGGFLQFSGLKVQYNMAQPLGERIVKVQVRANCQSNNYTILSREQNYNVVMSSYILNGGDSYNLEPLSSTQLNCTDYTALIEYIQAKSPLDYKIQDRQVNQLPLIFNHN